MLVIVESNPLKTVPVVVVFVHCRCIAIEFVCCSKEVIKLTVLFVAEQVPLELFGRIPLVKLSELTAHKHKFFTGMSKHISKESSYARKLVVIQTRHFVDKRAFAVNNFIMRDREHKAFAECVNHTECKSIVVIISVKRVKADV